MIHNRRAFDDAGAIDEHVHAAAILQDPGDEVGGALLRELAEILGIGIEFRAEHLCLRAGFRLVADVHADDVGAFAREREGDGLADSAAGPGDDGCFIFETFCVHKFCLTTKSPRQKGFSNLVPLCLGG